MGLIKGLDKAKACLEGFEFSEFRVVRRFCFNDLNTDEGCEQEIEIVIESDSRSSNYSLTLRFGGVGGLRLAGFGFRERGQTFMSRLSFFAVKQVGH